MILYTLIHFRLFDDHVMGCNWFISSSILCNLHLCYFTYKLFFSYSVLNLKSIGRRTSVFYVILSTDMIYEKNHQISYVFLFIRKDHCFWKIIFLQSHTICLQNFFIVDISSLFSLHLANKIIHYLINLKFVMFILTKEKNI